MRRVSFVGPLVLIAIGVVFLVKNIRPDLPLFDLFMTYWPFLLILWGGVRLVEVLAIHFRGGQLPMAGVSGGEWALIIVLSVIGSSVWGVQRFTHDNFGRFRVGGMEVFGESYDYSENQQGLKLDAKGRLVVDNPRGAVRVTGVDAAEVNVTARKTVRAMQRSEADKANEQSKLKIDTAGTVMTIQCNQDRVDGPRVTTDLEISAPKGVMVEVRGRYGDVEVTGVTGDVKINSDNAGVRLQNIGGQVKVDTRKSDIIRAVQVKGGVELTGRGRDVELDEIEGQVVVNGSYSGELALRKLAKPVRFESSSTEMRMERVPGEVQITLSTITATNVVGPVFLKARSKDVQLTDATETVTLDLDRGDIEIRQSKSQVGRIDARTDSGDIELALPAQSRFSLHATTKRGELSNDFDSKLITREEDHGGSISGALGAGPEIKLATNRGGLTVRKMS
ncbi:MAG: DUF4097 family beta strand repeat protein, partial [Acidobacteria bacterium]|nr:DUF4097 family beta strand repeat protein [Acidobacteriota bacterium]